MKTSYSDNVTQSYKSPVYTTRAAANRKNKKVNNAGGGEASEVPLAVPLVEKVKKKTKSNLSQKTNKSNLSHNVEVEKEVTNNNNPPTEVTNNNNPNGTPTLTQVDILPIFLNEPFKNHTLQLDDSMIENLNGDNWLCTDFIDFMVRHGLPHWKPNYCIVPTSDIETLLDFYNRKAKSNDPEDLELVANHRQLYKNFTTKLFRITTISFTKGLFYIIDMNFDATDVDGDYFQMVTIYDNLVRSDRKRGNQQLKNTFAISLFKKIIEFFFNYVIFDAPQKLDKTYHKQLLDDIRYAKCPIPQNKYDCSLYAFSILLHLLRGIRVTENIFTQQVITYFRKSLYIVLKAPKDELKANPKIHIDTDFITSFFGKTFITSGKPNYFLKYLHKCTNYVSPSKTSNKDNNKADVDDSSNNEEVDEIVDFTTTNNNNVSHSDAMTTEHNVVNQYLDTIFRHIFVNSMNQDEKFQMNNLDELYRKIMHYEIESNITLRRDKSNPRIGYCVYSCVSHKNCTFRASFGPIRSSKKIVLKNCYLYHNGIDQCGTYDNGKLFKTRITEKITPIIEKIEALKSYKPVPNDIVKAAKTLNGDRIKYDQAQKVLLKVKGANKIESRKSYELIIPYLEEFKKLNPGSTAVYDVDEKSSITKIFICPAIMNNKLRYARPTMSLDAAHLSDDNKGTLYLACIKTGNDEILPIAIGITEENENMSGWKFFLNNLDKSCSNLTVNHPLERCNMYKLWTFVSDRDKGLIPSLREIFPQNHQTNCLFHIRQNVKTSSGIAAGEIVEDIGRTFSIQKEEYYFKKLQQRWPKMVNYLLKIDPKTWRNTEWTKNKSLPPRYGIVNSNSSESANSMFKKARTFNWLSALDTMLHKINYKISNGRMAYKDKRGMVAFYSNLYKQRYNACAIYNVIPINEEQSTYKVYVGEGDDYVHYKTQFLNMQQKTCTCGEWQDTELFCEHVMSYYRVIENKPLEDIYRIPFSQYYSYQYLNHFYKENVNPVIIDTLASDKTTKPPAVTNKRQAGRPPTRRLRKKSRSEITVKCSNCEKPGHNKRGCPKPIGYKEMKAQGLVTSDGSDSDDDDDVNDEVCDDSSSRTKQVRKCSNCGQPGHTKRVCPKPPRQEENLQEEENLLEENRDDSSSSSDEESDKKPSANDRLYHERSNETCDEQSSSGEESSEESYLKKKEEEIITTDKIR